MSSLSKSRYLAGAQCMKRLWWTVREDAAAELAETEGFAAARGRRVGELARSYVPDGVLIDANASRDARLLATRQAMTGGALAVYEAAFLADGVFVVVDILERVRGGWVLVEVKSTLTVKDEHLADVAVQLHVLRRAGVRVVRAEVMHLDRACRHPDLSNLFAREDVTALVEAEATAVPARAAAMIRSLDGRLPDVEPGAQCDTPRPCPFRARCHPPVPADHVSTLYRITRRHLAKLEGDGVESLRDVPDDARLSPVARRQVESVKAGALRVDGDLVASLRELRGTLAFVDFETVAPAVPAWHGCAPYEQVPVQWSCHVVARGRTTHDAWLAEPGTDPRPGFARSLVAACEQADTLVAYNASFERSRLYALAEAVPELGDELRALAGKLVDLLTIVREHVYHPAFGGSFGLKAVLPALVPGFGYGDLAVRDGMTAAGELEAMLLGTDGARGPVGRAELLAYCERDSLAMVRVWEVLWGLVGAAAA